MKDYERAEITGALEALAAGGWIVCDVDDEGDELVRVTSIPEALEAIEAVDVSTVYVRKASDITCRAWFQVVLGNEPGVAISDYSCAARQADFVRIMESLPDLTVQS